MLRRVLSRGGLDLAQVFSFPLASVGRAGHDVRAGTGRTAPVQVSDGGDWTRAGARQVEKSR